MHPDLRAGGLAVGVDDREPVEPRTWRRPTGVAAHAVGGDRRAVDQETQRAVAAHGPDWHAAFGLACGLWGRERNACGVRVEVRLSEVAAAIAAEAVRTQD